jgi:hypothetical protein
MTTLSFANSYQSFEETCLGLKIAEARCFEILVCLYQSTRRDIPVDYNVRIVAYRAVTMQRPRDKQIYKNRF